MTVSVPGATAFEYAGDGNTVAFSFPLKFLEAADLRVSTLMDDPVTGDEIETVMVLGTDYSLSFTFSLAGEVTGGTVTFLVAPTALQTVRLLRRTAPKQTVNLTDTGRTPGDTLEAQLDRLAMALQDTDQRFSDVQTTPGPRGIDGVSAVWFGAGAPSSVLGSDGDLYENNSNGDLYQKVLGAWTLRDNLRGPQGEPGEQGDPGPPGASGEGTGDMLAAQNLNDVADKPTAFNNIKQAATTSESGVVELATDGETITGSDTGRAVTPAGGAAAYEAKGKVAGINTQTNDYQLVLTDAGKIVEINSSSGENVTVPPNGTVAFPTGTRIDVVQYGTGQVTFVAGSGVTIRSSDSKLKLTGRYSGATLYKRGTNEWVLIGDIAT